MSNYNLGQGFVASPTNPTTSTEFESWIKGFPTYRTQKLKQALEKHNLEASEFVEVTPIINQIPDPQVQKAAHFFDIYKAYLPVKDLSNNRQYSVPIVAVFSKGGTASSSDLAIPISVAETYAMENLFPGATSKIVGFADLNKTRLSTSMTSDQLAAVVKMYQVPTFYRQVTIHFMGLGFVNSILALLGRVASGTKFITNKQVMASNMDTGVTSLADIIKSLIRSSE